MDARFRIITFGPHFETILHRHWNLKSYSKSKGTFTVGWHSDFMREYARLFGLPRHQKHLSMAAFKGVVIIGVVETVTRDSQRQPLPEDLYYSVIRRIIALENP